MNQHSVAYGDDETKSILIANKQLNKIFWGAKIEQMLYIVTNLWDVK